MDLLHSYVRMLRFFLPRLQRDDIVRELSEEIGAQAGEQEAALGRPLTPDEQAVLLRPYGHPLLTAARYRPQQYLIGPMVFPYYRRAVQLVVALVLVGHAIASVVLIGRDASHAQLARPAGEMAKNILFIVAWLTMLAAIVERLLAGSHPLETWDPKRLLPPAPRHGRRALLQRRGEAPFLSGLVVAVVLSAWWLLAFRFPHLMFGPGAADLAWAPAMNRLFPVLVMAQVLLLVDYVSRFLRPHDIRLARATSVASRIAGMTVLLLILAVDGGWIVWREAADTTARTTVIDIAGNQLSLLDVVNYCFSIPVTVAAIAGGVSLAHGVFRRFSGPRRGAVAAALLLSSGVVTAFAAAVSRGR